MLNFYKYTLDYDADDGTHNICGVVCADSWESAMKAITIDYGSTGIDNVTISYLNDSACLELKPDYFKLLEGNVIYG